MELLPLEKLFIKKATQKACFPVLSTDYAEQYRGIVRHLREKIYPDIDTGLAANSSVPGVYTLHNSEHFDEVVQYAGFLLGIKTGDEHDCGLSPYELYILLVAIRIHDIGNMLGREQHEKQCFPMLRSFGAIAGDNDPEKKIIANIAQAHGGKSSSGEPDTIHELEPNREVSKGSIRPRLIASIVRFADEICENRNRAAGYLLKFGNMPKHNEIFHRYANSISANTIKNGRLILKYTVSLEDIAKPWGCAKKGKKRETYLIDEILERLEKMDRERRYCNVYSREIYTIDSIRATIEIVNENHDAVKTITVPELSDFGYPEDKKGGLKQQLQEYCGGSFHESLVAKD